MTALLHVRWAFRGGVHDKDDGGEDILQGTKMGTVLLSGVRSRVDSGIAVVILPGPAWDGAVPPVGNNPTTTGHQYI